MVYAASLGNNYLDLRIIAVDFVLLIVLMVVVPLLVRGRSREARIGGRVSAAAGALFGSAVTYFCLMSSTASVTIGACAVMMALVVASVYVNSRMLRVGPKFD